MQEILVKTLMTSSVTCLSPNDSLKSAVQLMVDQRFSCVVIADKGSPVGIVTERDLVKILLNKENNEILDQPASSLMSSPIFTLNQNESLFDAMVVSRAERVRHLPVVDDNEKLVGLVTQSDLANAHFHVVEIQSEIIEKSIQDKTKALEEANEELQALSMEDHLLEIGNRRSMEVDLNHTHATAVRYNHPYSVVLLDVDYFKLYNDHYGHTPGDEALKAVAKLLKDSIRQSDRLYRYGGEEMLLLLPDTNANNAQILSKRLIQSLYNQNIPHCKSPYEKLTVSAGVCDAIPNDKPLESWSIVVEEADKGLYQSKQDGRNRSTVADQ